MISHTSRRVANRACVLHTSVGRHAFPLCFPIYIIQECEKSKRLKTAFKSKNEACLLHLRHCQDLM